MIVAKLSLVGSPTHHEGNMGSAEYIFRCLCANHEGMRNHESPRQRWCRVVDTTTAYTTPPQPLILLLFLFFHDALSLSRF